MRRTALALVGSLCAATSALWLTACGDPDATHLDPSTSSGTPTDGSEPGTPSTVGPAVSPPGSPGEPPGGGGSGPGAPGGTPGVPSSSVPPGTAGGPGTPPPVLPAGGGMPGAAGMSPSPGGGPSGTAGTLGGGGMDTGAGGAVGMAGMNAGGNATGGSAPTEEVIPTVAGSDYTLTLPSATLVAHGPTGRITQLVVDGTNRLTTSAVHPINYGSSFWTAPQSVWNWPPPLDATDESTPRTDYVHAVEGNAIVLTSPPTAQGAESVSITKRLTADAARDVLVLDFTIQNTGAATISAAPWQITRVVPQGLTFYPTGTVVVQSQIPTTDMGGVTWLDYSGVTAGTKNIADGAEGWLAHVDGGLLFLKVFPELPAASAAPGEGEIEIYIDGPTSYVELEPQGAYAPIEPGATSPAWQVIWVVRPVPADVTVSLGSTTLLDWVRSLVASL